MRPPLSLPLGALKPHYDVLIVGSGYGGAVVASRLAERDAERPKKQRISIGLLERGREWATGDFPSTPLAALRQLQYETPDGRRGSRAGLFDLRVDEEMMVLVGCGLGGTSLINANVMLEPKAYIFKEGWPSGMDWATELSDYYKQVHRTLETSPTPETLSIRKRETLGKSLGESRERPATLKSPNLAVSFVTGVNKFGVPQRRCELCGDCVTGCNHGAKRTLDFNYLARAKALGVEMFCGMEVDSVRPSEGDYPWLVYVRPVHRGWRSFGAPLLAIRAKQVFLAAGTLGTTEILLRSRSQAGQSSTPASAGLTLSPMLGERFSGNGDVIAFSYNGLEKVEAFGYGVKVPLQPTVGPCITGMLDERGDDAAPSALPLSIQDAAVPGALTALMRFIGPWVARQTPLSWAGSGSGGVRSEWDTLSRGAQHGSLAKTQAFLVQAPDSGDGRLWLSPRGRLRIRWEKGAHDDLFVRINTRLADLTKNLGGRFAANPLWIRRSGAKLITVHPLGGVAMSDAPDKGVVNHQGQVFRDSGGVYDGLYACDGSIVPTPLGANPALTIAALAERIATKVALPDRSSARPHEEAPEPPVIPGQRGIRYAERLTGHISAANGRKVDLTLVLHLSADVLEEVLRDRRHTVRVIGTALTSDCLHSWSPNTATPDGACCRQAGTTTAWTIFNGTLNVFADDPRRPDTRLMVYRLGLEAADGTRTYLRGHKTINLETCRRGTWAAVTRFRFVLDADPTWIEAGPTAPGTLQPGDREPAFAKACDAVDSALEGSAGSGEVANSTADAFRLARSVEITNAGSFGGALWSTLRFAWFFVSEVLHARFWFLRPTHRQDPFERPPLDVPPRGHESEEPSIREVLPPIEGNRKRFRLRGFKSRSLADDSVARARHVVLGPGFGMSTDAFRSGTPSLVEYLVEQGFVVWLLDYRASDNLDASLTQFTLDDLVDDFKLAFEAVSERAGGQKIYVIAHCVASLVTTMALLKHGKTLSEQLEAVVLSQSFAYMDHPLVNRIKAWTRLPEIMKQLRFNPVLNVDDDLRSGWKARLFDRLLHLYPTREHCSSGVCRRTIFLYGEVVRHENLDRHAHDMMYDFFDRANLSSFVHIARMIRAGHIVDKFGKNEYLTDERARAITVRVTLFQGSENRLFRPPGGRKTFRWFTERTGTNVFGYVELPGFAHLDLFIGTQAAEKVFPRFVEALLTPDQIGRN